MLGPVQNDICDSGLGNGNAESRTATAQTQKPPTRSRVNFLPCNEWGMVV